MREQYLTQEGLHELKTRLQELKTVRRREVAEAIHSAKEQGDLSENAEYVSAKEEQRRIEEEIAEIEAILKHAHVVAHSNNMSVSVGSTVGLRWNGEEKVYRVVGSTEADPLRGKISNESPIGQALLGKKTGDTVHIPTPNGQKECEIIRIE